METKTSRRALLGSMVLAPIAGAAVASDAMPHTDSAEFVDEDIRNVEGVAKKVRSVLAAACEAEDAFVEAENATSAEIAKIPHREVHFVLEGYGKEPDKPMTLSTSLGRRYFEGVRGDGPCKYNYQHAAARALRSIGARERLAARIRARHNADRLAAMSKQAWSAMRSETDVLADYPVRTAEGLLRKLSIMASDDLSFFGDEGHEARILADLRRITGKEA